MTADKNADQESRGHLDRLEQESTPGPDRICFDYIKSGSFRVIHADGVIGGLTPRLDVHMDFWSERFPIPQQVTHLVNKDGTLGEEVKADRKSRKSIVREVEAGVVMDLETAKEFRDWLTERINHIEKITKDRKPGSEKL